MTAQIGAEVLRVEFYPERATTDASLHYGTGWWAFPTHREEGVGGPNGILRAHLMEGSVPTQSWEAICFGKFAFGFLRR